MLSEHLLSTVTLLPAAGALLLGLIPGRFASLHRWLALLVSLVVFAFSLLIWTGFDANSPGFQLETQCEWIPQFGISYHLGIDGISLPLILLTTFLTPLVVVAGWEVIKNRPAQYFAAFLLLEGMMIGVFAALDAMLFYVFWEAMLVPMFLIIGIWGGERRVYATVKFFLYTFFGSVFMLVALIYMYQQQGDFSIAGLHSRRGQIGCAY